MDDIERTGDSALMKLFQSDISGGITHCNMNVCMQKLHLPNENVGAFWTTYCHSVLNEERLYIAEYLGVSSVPVIVNIKFTVDYDPSIAEIYDTGFIKHLVYYYQEVMRENIRLNSEEDLTCVVLDYDGDIFVQQTRRLVKLRLQFPYCKIDLKTQQNIKPEYVKKLRAANISSCLVSQPIEPWDEIVQVPRDCVPMYGSREIKDEPLLVLNCIYGPISSLDKDYFLYDHSDDNTYTKSLIDTFIPSLHTDYSRGLIDQSIYTSNGALDLSRALPIFLSIGYWSRINISLKNETSPFISSPSTEVFDSAECRLQPLNIIKEMLPFLSKKRFEQEHYFLNIGRSIKSCSSGEEGLELWKEYSIAYENNMCDEIWPQLDMGNMLTYKTIIWYASLDSPEKYNTWIDSILNPIMRKALSLTHADIGYAIYLINWLDVQCVKDGRGIEWYIYGSNHWRKCGVEEIKKRIVNDFVKRCEGLRSKLSNEVQAIGDTFTKTSAETLIQSVTKLISKVKNTPFLNGVVSMATLYLMNDYFENYEHKSRYITGFKNCVFEVYTSYLEHKYKITRREGKPEDYLTITTGRNYEIFSEDSPFVKLYNSFMDKILPDPELKKWFEYYVASGFIGGNLDKKLPIFVGKLANNGKTTLIKVLYYVFGPLCIRVPTTLLTGKRGKSNEATSELVRFKYARFAIAQEPSTSEEMKSGPTKELTGDDPIYMRQNYRDGMDIDNQAKLIVVSNNQLPVDNPDRALEFRILVVPCISVFSENAPESDEMQKKIHIFKTDKNIDSKLPNIAKVLLWKAVETFDLYAKEGLPKCKIISAYTESYWARNDQFRGFFKKVIEKDSSSESFIEIMDAYDKFKTYITYNNPSKNTKIPTIQTFVDGMERIIGEPSVDDKWVGYRYKTKSKFSFTTVPAGTMEMPGLPS